MKLSDDEFLFLKNELDNTHILTDDEMGFLKISHPQLYYTTIGKKENGVSLFTEKSFIFSLTNEKLNNFICDKFEEPLENLYMVHRLIYGVNGFARRHKDRFTTHKTVSIILSDKFEGGDMYINDEKIQCNEKGEYIIFNGGRDWHEVKKIKNGYREVLVIWFSKIKLKTKLI